jgi:hypothetical protein
MSTGKAFGRRVVKKVGKNYIGLDVRILPLIGILGSIVAIILIQDPLWLRFVFGYIILVILIICIYLAARDVWKEDMQTVAPLAELRDRQENVREHIHPILVNLDWDIANIDTEQWGQIEIRLAFVNLLVREQQIDRLSGELYIEGLPAIKIFEFRDAPRRLFPATISNSFSERVTLPDSAKDYVKKLWEENKRKPAARLTLRMVSPDNDPITFDPALDHPLALSISS